MTILRPARPCALAGLLAACAPPPATEVMVRFAADPELRPRIARIHVQVWAEDDKPVLDRDDAVTDAAADLARVPVVPREGDASRVFSVRGELLDTQGASLGVERAVSGFHENELRELLLVFDSACAAVPDCGDGRRCVSGVCLGDCVDPVAGHAAQAAASRCGDCQRCAGYRCEALDDGLSCGCSGDRCQSGSCVIARPVLSLSLGSQHTCAIPVNGDLECWGSNAWGQLGLSGVDVASAPRSVLTLDTYYRGVYASDVATCVLGGDDARTCFGQNWLAQLGDGVVDAGGQRPLRLTAPPLRELSAGGSHYCGLDAGSALWCWGYDQYGQLGRGTSNKTEPVPARVGSDTGYRLLDAGGTHTCAVKTDGTLSCWGYNDSGQLGVGDYANRTTPVRPGCAGGSTTTCFSDWQSVAAGSYHTCAIRADQSLWCWGGNGNAQVGVGTTGTDEQTPLPVAQGQRWSSVAAGFQHTCAINADGSLWCWGAGAEGQLGNGGRDRQSVPTAVVPPDTTSRWDRVRVSKGSAHSCALRSDRTLWCWGRNVEGQLGLGSSDPSVTTPRRVCFP